MSMSKSLCLFRFVFRSYVIVIQNAEIHVRNTECLGPKIVVTTLLVGFFLRSWFKVGTMWVNTDALSLPPSPNCCFVNPYNLLRSQT